MNLKLFLEHLLNEQAIDEDIDEAAVGVAQARSEQLAIAITPSITGRIKTVVLYRPRALLESVVNRTEPGDRAQMEDLIRDNNIIVGMVSYHKYSKNIYEVQLAAADSGYGPLVYDLALSILYPNFLISDRGSVSKTAENVWKFYLNNRKDVEKQPLISDYDNEFPSLPNDENYNLPHYELEVVHNDIEECKLVIAKSHGKDKQRAVESCKKLQNKLDKLRNKVNKKLAKNPLSYMYRIKKPKSFTSLTNEHVRLMAELKRLGHSMKEKDFLRMLDRCSEDWAQSKF